jgi:hypothetical protein
MATQVLAKTRQGECFVELRAFLDTCILVTHTILTSRLTTPINPALKPDRRGIGKKRLGISAYATPFVV